MQDAPAIALHVGIQPAQQPGEVPECAGGGLLKRFYVLGVVPRRFPGDQLGAQSVDIAEIEEALEEALALLDRPGDAYAAAPPMVRRMMNQALFEQIQLLDGEVTDATFAPWAEAMAGIARPSRARAVTRQENGQGLLRVVSGLETEARNDQGPRSLGGPGLYFSQMVRVRGL